MGLPDMRGRLCQDGRDNPRLVLRSDWSMASVAIRQIDDAIFDNSRAHKWKRQPFREECRTEVDGRNARPVEKAFGDPVVARGVAFGIFPRRNLRHVYNDFERRPLGSVREIRRCRNESRANGIAKISRAGAGCRPDYVVVLQEFTYHDLRAAAPKRLRAFVLLVDHRADSVTSFKKMLHCVVTGLTRRADHQNRLRAHHSSPPSTVPFP